MKKLVILSLSLLLVALVPAVAHAVEYGGIGGTPANPDPSNDRTKSIFIYELEPGAQKQDGVKVYNNSDTTATISLTAVDAAPSSDGAFACAQNASEKVGVGSWITLAKDTITLGPGTNEVVGFTLAVPNNATVGEQNGCIAIQEVKDTATPDGGGVVLSFRSAIRVAVTIPGDIVKALAVTDVSLSPDQNSSTAYVIRPSIANSGNVSIDTKITSRLVSFFGVTIDSVTATYPVLQGTTAQWNFEVERPFWGGFYRADVEATYNGNVEDGVGVVDEATNESVNSNSQFIFIPPSPIALIIELALLAGLALATFLLIRRIVHHKKVARHWEQHTVKKGDSLQSIAKQHGVSWKSIATANKLKAPYHLEVGSELKVPPKATEK